MKELRAIIGSVVPSAPEGTLGHSPRSARAASERTPPEQRGELIVNEASEKDTHEPPRPRQSHGQRTPEGDRPAGEETPVLTAQTLTDGSARGGVHGKAHIGGRHHVNHETTAPAWRFPLNGPATNADSKVHVKNEITPREFEQMMAQMGAPSHNRPPNRAVIELPEIFAAMIDDAEPLPDEARRWLEHAGDRLRPWLWITSPSREAGGVLAARLLQNLRRQLTGAMRLISVRDVLADLGSAPLYGPGSRDSVAAGYADYSVLAIIDVCPGTLRHRQADTLVSMLTARRDHLRPTIVVSTAPCAAVVSAPGSDPALAGRFRELLMEATTAHRTIPPLSIHLTDG